MMETASGSNTIQIKKKNKGRNRTKRVQIGLKSILGKRVLKGVMGTPLLLEILERPLTLLNNDDFQISPLQRVLT